MRNHSWGLGSCILGVVVALVVVIAPSAAQISSAAAPSNAALMSKLQWRNIGPWVGGRVVAVAGVPSKTNLFYMGAVDGGIWKSTSYGIKWVNISDGTLPGSNSIGALAVALSDPSTIYAGTGESDIRADVITGDGVYKSTDAGKTWQYAGLRETHTISGIVIDPAHPNIAYAASMGHVFKANPDRGVFKTVDGGKTWNKVLFVDDKTGAIDIAMDAHDSNVLYASMWQASRTPWSLTSGGPGSGLYKSTDAGRTWSNISRNSGLPQEVLGKMGVAVSASNSKIVYAIIQAKNGGVFRSDDAGATWKRVNQEYKLRQRAFYYMKIFVDPTNPDVVYVPEVDALWVSRNGGKTFTKLHTPHGDNHALWINPQDPQILLEGNDGGATVSTDGGQTWSSVLNQPTGQFYHVGLDDQFPFNVYGAQQDEGSTQGPSASIRGFIALADWHDVAYGESTFVAPDPGNPDITYGSGYFSIFLRYDSVTGQYRSVSPWPLFQEGSSSGELRFRFGWTHPIMFSPTNPKELLAAAQVLFRSDDRGETWQRISPDLTRNDPSTEAPTGGPIDLDQTSAEVYPIISSLAVSPLDGNVLWAGSDDGLVHITTNGGKSWQTITPPALPQRAQITSIEASHVAKGTAYLTASRYMWDDFHPYVFETSDFGHSWRSLVAGIPDDQYVFAIREDPQDASLLFAGTKDTVYVSFDSGSYWQPLTLNLPRVQVRDIAINNRQGDVAIATHGRAFWLLDDLTVLEQLTKRSPSVSSDALVLFAPQRGWLSHAFGASEFASEQVAAGQNPPFGATIYFNMPSSYNGSTPAALVFSDAQGHAIRTVTLHLRSTKAKPSQGELDQETPAQRKYREEQEATGIAPGMNRYQWNLRYSDATEVTGFWVPIAAGGLSDEVSGPVVVPGTYQVELRYGSEQRRQVLNVSLDPRLHASPAALEARLSLLLRINAMLNLLDTKLNQAIALQGSAGSAPATQTDKQRSDAFAALDNAVDAAVQLNIHSSERSVLYPTKLRDHLAYLAADIELSYDKPTQAQYAVFDILSRETSTAEQKLDSAMTAVKRAR